MIKKRNVEKSAERNRVFAATRPHPALGTAPGQESKWETCDLARVLVKPSQLEPLPALENTQAIDPAQRVVQLPEHFNFGIGPAERDLVFHQLPFVGVQRPFLQLKTSQDISNASETAAQRQVTSDEQTASDLMARITSLSNASAKGIAYENRRRIIVEFSEPGQPNDTGRSEVQAALMTMKIRNIWSHLEGAPRDIHTRRTLRSFIHQRAKILKYLRRMDRDRYTTVLDRLGLDPRAVEGEIIVR